MLSEPLAPTRSANNAAAERLYGSSIRGRKLEGCTTERSLGALLAISLLGRGRRHDLRQTRVVPESAEFLVLVDIGKIAMAVLFGFLQAC